MGKLMASGYGLPVIASVGLHGLLLAAAVIGWQAAPVERAVKPQTIQAQLVQLQPKAPEPVAKPKPAPTPKPAPKPKPEPKPKPKPEPKPTPKSEVDRAAEREAARQRAFEEALAAEEARLAAETEAQLTASYVALITRRIENHWSRPPSARRGMQALLEITLVPTGQVTQVTVVEGSGSAAFDRAAEQAVRRADRFPELQELYASHPGVFERDFRRLRLLFTPEDLRL